MTVVKLGAALGAPVVLLCSKQARPAEVVQRASSVRGARCVAVDLETDYEPDWPKFGTSMFPDAIFGAYGDLSLKRNLGLLIGRMVGWKTLLFLDDDIFGLSTAQVKQAVGALQHHSVVGMPARDFPDNSVVCHARRFDPSPAPKEEQDVFVSGSALAVNAQETESFFPQIYNEDWLFLVPHVDRREAASHAKVRQERYNPFDSPERAARQEFGDVLAEGLIGYLHQKPMMLDRLPSQGYWKAFLSHRADLIATAAENCRQQAGRNPYARDALRALKCAEAMRSAIQPKVLVDYVAAWQAD
ncbi:MAG: hypothetical protein ACJ73E_11725, partial [Mycobacteriales bacterium]